MLPFGAKRALEGLRTGVPNEFAVRRLGCESPEIESRFRKLLEDLSDSQFQRPTKGFLIAGGYGTGKSHTLAYLEQEALDSGFVVSYLVVSRELPVHSSEKVLQYVARTARVKDINGPAFPEIAYKLLGDQSATSELVRWASGSYGHTLLSATIDIFGAVNLARGPLAQQIIDFWSGHKIYVHEVKAALSELGLNKKYKALAVPAAISARGRIELLPRIARLAGYKGWVVFFDELELLRQFFLRQRAKSYAELARWFGIVPDDFVPGYAAVGAITDDYVPEIIIEKKDQTCAPEVLRKIPDRWAAELACAWISLLDDAIELNTLNDEVVERVLSKLADLYEEAYSWRPKYDLRNAPAYWATLRKLIRYWVQLWDSQYHYQASPEDVEIQFHSADSGI